MSDASDLVPVPTLEELGRRGLARNVTRAYVNRIDGSTREDTRWEVTDAGYAESDVPRSTTDPTAPSTRPPAIPRTAPPTRG